MSGQEDISPSDFVKKIRELGDKRDKEDAERFAQLEQDIYRDREERAARRAERARSISPEKPAASTPGSFRTRESASPSPSLSSHTGNTSSMEQTPTALARSGTLSWQQRPKSSSGRRPLSQLAAENAARSPRALPTEPSEDTSEPSRAQIAESLASKDPTWFRQTADRGVGSAAYRKNQVEDSSPAIHSSLVGKQHLPGLSLSRESTPEPSIASPPPIGRSPSPERLQQSTAGWDNKFVLTPAGPATSKSPLEPPKIMPTTDSPLDNRPPSPTKGMGGFVQSAMMKRSDSVSKRWSAQGSPGLSRQSSTISNRGSWRESKLGESTSMPRLDVHTQDEPSESTARPVSTHKDGASTPTDAKAKKDEDSFAKPALPLHTRSRSTVSLRSSYHSDSNEPSQPPSPSKRWSPTKSTWLESALNKTDDKPKPQPPPSQPAWMADVTKAKQQRGSAESVKTPLGDTVAGASASVKSEVTKQPLTTEETPKRTRPEPSAKPPTLTKEVSAPAVLATSLTPKPSPTPGSKPPVSPKPASALKTDFRSNLKSRQQPTDSNKAAEPEFLSAFGNLRRAKTENYVAPDTLKNNITAGKAALAVTGGPAKRERVDELKESLLKQKEAMKTKAATEGPKKPAEKPAALSSTPEAVTKRLQMNKTGGEFKDPLKEKKSHDAEVPKFLTRQKTGDFRDPLRERKTQDAETPKFLTRQKTGDFKDPLKERKTKESEVPAFLTRQKTGDFKDPLKDKKAKESEVPEFLARQRTMREKPKPDIPQKPTATLPVKTTSLPLQTADKSPLITPTKPTANLLTQTASLPLQELDKGPALTPSKSAASIEPKQSTPAKASEVEPQSQPPQANLFAGGLKAGASNKLADRFNPALANMLARGPSPAGRPGPSQSSDSATPFAPPRSKQSNDGEAASSKELTHMTKGRARGPKRKAPTSKAGGSSTEKTAVKAPASVKDESTAETKIASPIKSTFPSTPSKPVSVASVPLVKPKDVLQSSPATVEQTTAPKPTPKPTMDKVKPFTPSKSPLLQRSGCQDSDNAQSPAAAAPKPSLAADRTPLRADKPAISTDYTPSGFSPKPAAISEKPATMKGHVASGFSPNPSAPLEKPLPSRPTSVVSPKPSPTPAQKPAALDWKKPSAFKKPATEDITPPLSAEPNKTEVSSLWAASSKPTSTIQPPSKPQAALPRAVSPIPSRSPERQEDDLSSVSVSNAKSMWGRSTDTSTTRGRAKSPVKLPTRADEEQRMKEAGLTSSEGSGSGLGLGLGLDKPSASSNARSPFPLSPPLTAGLPTTADNSAADTESRRAQPVGVDGRPPKQPLRHAVPPLSTLPPQTRPLSISSKTLPDSPIPQTSEAGDLFAAFFDERPIVPSPRPELNILSVLEYSPLDVEKVTTVRKTMQEILLDGKITPILPYQEHILFDECMYVCVHHTSSETGWKGVDVYFWIGNAIPAAYTEEAHACARKIANQNNGRLQVVTQGKEPPLFFQALGGIVTTFRGPRRTTTSGLPKTFLLCIRRHNGHIAFDEVDFSLSSFCSGFAYIVCSNSRLYLWKGNGSHAEELGCARLIAMDLGTTSEIIEVEEGKEPAAFFRVFPSSSITSPNLSSTGIPRSADHWRLKPNCANYRCRLFQILDPNNPTSMEPASPSGGIKERASAPTVNSFLSGLSSAAQGLTRKRSWSSMLPISTSNSPTRSRPHTPISPMAKSPSPFAGNGLLSTFSRRESEADTSAAAQSGPVREIAPFSQRDLDASGIYVLDAFFEIYIIIGPTAHTSSAAFTTGLIFAQDYGITAASLEDRPFVPVTSVVLEGAPRDMKVCFRGWSDEFANRPATETLMLGRANRRGRGGLRVVALAAALAATRGA